MSKLWPSLFQDCTASQWLSGLWTHVSLCTVLCSFRTVDIYLASASDSLTSSNVWAGQVAGGRNCLPTLLSRPTWSTPGPLSQISSTLHSILKALIQVKQQWGLHPLGSPLCLSTWCVWNLLCPDLFQPKAGIFLPLCFHLFHAGKRKKALLTDWCPRGCGFCMEDLSQSFWTSVK